MKFAFKASQPRSGPTQTSHHANAVAEGKKNPLDLSICFRSFSRSPSSPASSVCPSFSTWSHPRPESWAAQSFISTEAPQSRWRVSWPTAVIIRLRIPGWFPWLRLSDMTTWVGSWPWLYSEANYESWTTCPCTPLCVNFDSCIGVWCGPGNIEKCSMEQEQAKPCYNKRLSVWAGAATVAKADPLSVFSCRASPSSTRPGWNSTSARQGYRVESSWFEFERPVLISMSVVTGTFSGTTMPGSSATTRTTTTRSPPRRSGMAMASWLGSSPCWRSRWPGLLTPATTHVNHPMLCQPRFKSLYQKIECPNHFSDLMPVNPIPIAPLLSVHEWQPWVAGASWPGPWQSWSDDSLFQCVSVFMNVDLSIYITLE